ELEWLLAGVPSVTLDCVTGGTVVRQEQQRLSRPPTILVGTPGRLLDHIRTGTLGCSGVTQLVLDEADQMLDLGFRDDLEQLLAGGERTLVFVRTRIETAELADRLAANGFAAQPISGELSQVLRTRTLEAFRRGAITTLIATDVAARGLDIPLVTTVVHFDPP